MKKDANLFYSILDIKPPNTNKTDNNNENILDDLIEAGSKKMKFTNETKSIVVSENKKYI
jgi:hypothetical protein